jgi:hypothetical protein
MENNDDELPLWVDSEPEDDGEADAVAQLADAIDRLVSLHLEESQLERRSRIVRTRYDLSTDPLRDALQSDGDARLAAVKRLLEVGFGVDRTDEQRSFHHSFIVACLPHFYGAQWSARAHTVMRKMGISLIEPWVLVMCPRRWGKTYSVSMFVAAMMLCVPGQVICVFSPGGRQSRMIADLVIRWINTVYNGTRRIVGRTSESTFVSQKPLPPGASFRSLEAQNLRVAASTCALHALPSNEKSELRVLCG